jgi:cytochrome c551/c552
MKHRLFLTLGSALPVLWLLSVSAASTGAGAMPQAGAHGAAAIFQSSHECLACHNGLSAPSGEDVSIGAAWRGSMMANAARDPYWMAGVRRETIDHPTAREEIEDECSVCHMPMTRTLAAMAGRKGEIFAHLPVGRADASDEDRLAADGVSCTACHQIQADRLGARESFTGGYVIAAPGAAGARPIFGPFAIEAGLASIMRSATGFTPTEARHIQQSELCAACHTLITHALGPNGESIGELPEQVPYLEWRHSAYRAERSCQSCHMPVVDRPTPIASVMGQPREGLSRHTFVGGNLFMIRLLNRFRDQLGVEALPQELETAAALTAHQLERATASVSILRAEVVEGMFEIDVAVRNLTGHKLPTGYPSRRAWLHVVVRDREGRAVFESGAVEPGGLIQGNDNDARADSFEPHRREITAADQVQIYEAVMVDARGAVTTGLLHGVRYVKDNRLLPRGFDKTTAEADIRVHGAAAEDADFTGDGDRVRYMVRLGDATGPFTIEAALRYQTIAYRWAQNLRVYDAPEPKRFVSMYESMAGSSAVTLARARAETR